MLTERFPDGPKVRIRGVESLGQAAARFFALDAGRRRAPGGPR